MTQPKLRMGVFILDTIRSFAPFERLTARLQRLFSAEATLTGTGKYMENIEWKVVVKMYGMLEAQALVGRLQAEGIPAQAWQEGAGKALGIMIGSLGEVRVVVPSQFYEEAKTIADEDFSEDMTFDDEWEDDEWEDDDL